MIDAPPPPLPFSVQREDPRLEEALLDRIPGPKRFFGITAAGCSLLQLATRPDLTELIGADIDPRQTAWARFKLLASKSLNRRDFARALGVSHLEPGAREALISKIAALLPAEDRDYLKAHKAFFGRGAFDEGTFERVFEGLRHFIERFIASRDTIDAFFEGDPRLLETLAASQLWPIGFELFFHQQLLQELFGARAIRQAPPGSFPRFFQSRFEWALQQPDASRNCYLSHVLRGRYGALDQSGAVPDYLHPERYVQLAGAVDKVQCVTGSAAEVLTSRPGPYSLIQLSNILDWSSAEETEALVQPVLDNLAPGGFLLVRQLNNARPLPQAWFRALDFDPALERTLHAADRSFFYSAIRVGRKPELPA